MGPIKLNLSEEKLTTQNYIKNMLMNSSSSKKNLDPKECIWENISLNECFDNDKEKGRVSGIIADFILSNFEKLEIVLNKFWYGICTKTGCMKKSAEVPETNQEEDSMKIQEQKELKV